MRRVLRQLLGGSIGVLLLACGEGSFSPSVANVAGDYQASVLTFTEAGVTTDVLALGGSLALTLNQDGTTSGRLFAPGLAEGGGDFDADLAGTWTLSGSTVSFDHEADTFLRDVAFTAQRDRLRSETTLNGIMTRVVLTK